MRLPLGKRDQTVREHMLVCLEGDRKISGVLRTQFVEALINDLEQLEANQRSHFRAYLLENTKVFDGEIRGRVLSVLGNIPAGERKIVGELALHHLG